MATLAILIPLLSIQSTWGQSSDRYRVKVGEPHFDFQLPSIDGKQMVQLSDYRGKKLLLFHFASW